MDRLKIMAAHYIIMGGTMMKLSEVCIAKGDINSAEEMDEIFVRHITEDVERLKKDPNNVDVTRMDIASSITHVTFSGLYGTHALEYYITLVSD